MRKRGSLAELAFPTWRLLGLRQQTDRTQAPEVRALHVPVRMRDGVDECDVGLQARDVRSVATLFEGVARVCVWMSTDIYVCFLEPASAGFILEFDTRGARPCVVYLKTGVGFARRGCCRLR